MAKERAMLVRERRKEIGLTQKELGERLGVSYGAISGWERTGEIPQARLAELAEALDLDPEDLLGGSRAVRDNDGDRVAFMAAVGGAGLSLTAMAVLYRLGYDASLTADRGQGLEFVGSLARIASAMTHVSQADVEAVWPEILSSGLVHRVTDAQWHVALCIP